MSLATTTKHRRFVGLLLMGLLSSSLIYGQSLVGVNAMSQANTPVSAIKGDLDLPSIPDETVTGTVTASDTEEPLSGVTVLVKGTTTGTYTDAEGKFTVNVPDLNSTLVLSYVGYSTIEIPLEGRSEITITLQQDVTSLDEVVVVGYGSQKKRDVTAAIASVSEREIAEIPVASPAQALQGRVAGVDIQNAGGRPGQNPNILIRGRRSINAGNDPLFVVDGIPLTNDGTAFDINPQDIASVEILKDAASTSIYGSRGANGVILITTKRGSQGKTTISYDGFAGISSAIRQVDMMNGEEFANLKRESRRADENLNASWNGVIPPDNVVFDDPVELESIQLGRSTDYQDLVLQNGLTQNHQLGIRGGNAKTQFLISANYYDEEGIIDNMDFARYSVRLNLDHRVTDWLRLGTSTLVNRTEQNFGSTSAWAEAITNNPLGLPRDPETGELRFLPTNDGIRTNPLSELVPGAYADERIAHTIFTSLYAEMELFKGFRYRMNFGPEVRFRRRGRFRASETNANRGGPGDARKEERTDFSYTLENILTYDRAIGNSNLKLTFLQSIQDYRREGTVLQVANLPFDSQQFNNLGTGQTIENFGSQLEEWQLASFMGRVNYEIAGKYLIQANVRADGSSRLAPGNQWAYFPGVSVGWRLVDEPFLQGTDWLQDLKLRGSWGQVGNTSIDPYQTQGVLDRTAYNFNDAPAFGYRLFNLSNSDLTWEKTATLDFGVDFSFFLGRIEGSIDWYQSNTTDLLLERRLPITSGYGRVLFNVGETQNTGIEISIQTVNFDTPSGFRWTTQLNWFTNNEEIVSLSNGKEDDVANQWFIGEPIQVFYDFEKIGIWQADQEEEARQYGDLPGEIRVNDVNGNGQYDGDDRKILGSDVPDWSGGITNRFEYKGFDLSAFFFARVGHLINSSFHNGNNALFGRYNNLNVDYWTPTNPTNAFPRPNQNQERPKYSSTMSYFDGDYIKLRNATLGYTFPASITETLGMSSLRVYFSAQNPWFASTYETFDPEAADDGFNNDGNESANDNESISANVGDNIIPASKLFLLDRKSVV